MRYTKHGAITTLSYWQGKYKVIRNISALKNLFKIKELKQKVFFTLMILVIYRLGTHIPVPFIDRAELSKFAETQKAASGLFQTISLFSGRNFEQMSVFALGIMPYISVSIILQVLGVVIPRLQKLQREGSLGQAKINRWTRMGTVALAAFQGFGLGIYLMNQNLTYMNTASLASLFLFTTVVTMTAGCTFIMWLGERITDKGIGNGISLIIAVGIMARYPGDFSSLCNQIFADAVPMIWLPVIIVLFVLSVIAIALVQEGTRRIPIQHAKRMVGRKVMGGGTSYLPLKINTAGVIPVIFSSALLSFPSFLAAYVFGSSQNGGWLGDLVATESSYNVYAFCQRVFGLEQGGIFLLLKSLNFHIIVFALLTGFFCFFYTSVVFNPDDVANNLKRSGSYIPGKRPGKPTSEYIDYVLTRISTVGAVFLVCIAVLSMIMMVSFRMPFSGMSFVGGTGLIIVVGVLLDTLRQIEAQLMMRHYDGFAQKRVGATWR
ncbi:preprotein translocase subunit SecY [Candidatus Sumerlaeota bacterium]|nr:preprotein translocase subunit SecY [Candidatus Sumerlaeota bacterium]